MSARLLSAAAAALLLFALVPPADAQLLTRPHLDWRTLRTDHYDFHFPASLEPWTRAVAARVESVHAEVARLVGHAPSARITVIVDDPSNVSNGLAVPVVDVPVLYLFPTPPGPTSGIGHHRDWGELLAIHEIAHLAHLTRPTRNPRQRLLFRLLPLRFSALSFRTPRWVAEGYATYVEGRLSGSGRPHGVVRAAVLRQRALEGRLPTYGQLNGDRSYQSLSMAYLAGSAFLEWLVDMKGEESLQHLWRRMTARQTRSFAEAFAGVYGGTPSDLYGRFTAELTGQALAVEQLLMKAPGGIITGDTIQQRDWYTGDPALSPDGEHIAIVLAQRDEDPRLVVWKTIEEPESEKAVRARERAGRRDPEDVPAIEWRPRAKKVLAALHAVGGRAPVEPRFFADGKRILVGRAEPMADGVLRPDLFIWHWERGRLQRVTRGAGLHDADPSPDGDRAAAIQCVDGSCSLVDVDLRSGAIRVVAAGTPSRAWYRPRYAPDGARIVAAVQRDGIWRLATVDRATGTVREIPTPQGVSVYDAAFESERALVAISEQGGIPNVVRVDPSNGTVTPLTRLTSAALAPEPNRADRSIYYLQLHADGVNLNRIAGDTPARPFVIPDSALAPAVPVPGFAADTFALAPPGPSRAYGLGPRHRRLFPGGAIGADGFYVSAAAHGSDPIGRFAWTLQGAYGEEESWRGAALDAVYRRWRPAVGAQLFAVRHRPSLEEDGRFASPALDIRYGGALVSGDYAALWSRGTRRLRLGVSAGRLDGFAYEDIDRHLAFAEAGGAVELVRRTDRRLTMDATLHGAVGRTGAGDAGEWARAVTQGAVRYRAGASGIDAQVLYARTGSGAPVLERPVIGGLPVPLVDPGVLSQRIAMPALPTALLGGDELVILRGALTGEGLSPYYWIARVAGTDRWHRVIGSEAQLSLPDVPWLQLPATDLLAGVGYSLDEPFRKRTRGYLSLVFRP